MRAIPTFCAALATIGIISTAVLTQDTLGVVLTGDSYEGLLLNVDTIIARIKNDPKKHHPEPVFWQPTNEDIKVMEQHLKSFLMTYHNLSDQHNYVIDQQGKYKRQYLGLVQDGSRVIITRYFHESTKIVKEGTWKEKEIAVMGGGQYYFRTWYDNGKKAYTKLEINAPL
jgi:hypothetical protein